MFHCTPFILPPEAGMARHGARAIEFRQPGYDEEFDASTLFYDVFVSRRGQGSDLVFVGPPLLNLLPALYGARAGSRTLASIVSRYYLRDRCCDIWIPDWKSDTVQLAFEFGSYRLTARVDANDLYKGKRVLYTLSKDNDIRWIVDWVEFHVRNHGANAVLIYDNASTKYTGEALEASLRTEHPDLEINVVHWPYRYGPQGLSRDTGWDSDFCQAGAFQDARFRFLGLASSVLNCDIDELVVSAKGHSVFEAAERSGSGCTMFRGTWISNAMSGPLPLDGPRHSHFRYLERPHTGGGPRKWCVVPGRCTMEEQWSTHTVRGKDVPACDSDAFSYRHFRSISTNWKYQRYQPAVVDPRLHEFDEALDRAFERAAMARHGVDSTGVLSDIVRHIRRFRKLTHAGA